MTDQRKPYDGLDVVIPTGETVEAEHFNVETGEVDMVMTVSREDSIRLFTLPDWRPQGSGPKSGEPKYATPGMHPQTQAGLGSRDASFRDADPAEGSDDLYRSRPGRPYTRRPLNGD